MFSGPGVICANDGVFLRVPGEPAQLRHESIGGRFEMDGTFRGTRWLSVCDDPGDDEPADLQSTPTAPTADEIAALRALLDEMLRRDARRS